MGRIYLPESEKPKKGDVAEDPVTYGRVYVTGDAEPSVDSGAVEVTEPDTGAPPAGAVTVEEPKGNASTEEWAAFAVQQGATDADLVDEDGAPLGRDALRDKYATPTG